MKNLVMLMNVIMFICFFEVTAFGQNPQSFPMPIMAGEEMKCNQGNSNSYSHDGKREYAWDFSLADTGGDSDMGLPVVSSVDGRVMYAEDYNPRIDGREGENSDPWGECVVVSCSWCDPKEQAALIGHLDQIFVRPGEMVKRGQVIGLMGDADGYYSAHIH